MGSNPERYRLATLEERIQLARAEHSVRIGYAMGDAILAVWGFFARKFRHAPAKFIAPSRQ